MGVINPLVDQPLNYTPDHPLSGTPWVSGDVVRDSIGDVTSRWYDGETQDFLVEYEAMIVRK